MSDDYVIREAQPEEIGRVIEFLDDHHAKEDVIGQGFVKKHGEKSSLSESRVKIEGFFSKYTSLIVVRVDEIVGAAVLYPAEDDVNESGWAGRSEEMESAVIRMLVGSSIYEEYEPKKMLKIRKLAVHREHRGRGLAKKLIGASVDWAEKSGYEMVFSLFSTPAARRAAEHVGFVKFADVDLRELRDSKGEPLLADCSPNNVIPLMTMKTT